MARKYTAEDFQAALAGRPGVYLSDADRKLAQANPDAGMSILSAKDRYGKAQTDEERSAANAAAELIRRREGNYSGGRDGSGFSLDYTYSPKADRYQSPYTDLTRAASEKILNREPFQYSPAEDPSYQAHSEKYRNAGRAAMENTLGNAAALTGGQVNSYALTAAQQANDAYNAKMSDIIPTLEQAAYDRYQGELNQSRNDLSMLQGLDNTAYGRFADRRADELSAYDRDYGADRNIVGDRRYEDETAYNRDKYQEETDYERQRYEKELEFEQAMALAESAAKNGDFSGYRALGFTDAQIAQMRRDWLAELWM